MRTLTLATLMMLAVAGAALGQTETFDLAKFVVPQGWDRKQSNGALLLGAGVTRNGRASYGQIFLYPSQSGGGSAKANFLAEWKQKIVAQWGAPPNPKPQIERDPSGWIALSDTFDHMVGEFLPA